MDERLAQQLEVITNSTASLLAVIDELREVATTRLENIEREVQTTARQLQQSILLLTELAQDDPRPRQK